MFVDHLLCAGHCTRLLLLISSLHLHSTLFSEGYAEAAEGLRLPAKSLGECVTELGFRLVLNMALPAPASPPPAPPPAGYLVSPLSAAPSDTRLPLLPAPECWVTGHRLTCPTWPCPRWGTSDGRPLPPSRAQDPCLCCSSQPLCHWP